MSKLISFILLFAHFAMAKSDRKKIIVQSLDRDIEFKSLDSKYYDKQYGLRTKKSKNLALPSTKEVEKIFTRAGLKTELRSMDQLDRDILFRSAMKYKIEKLKAKYPKIEEQKLVKLRKVITHDK